MRIHADDCDMPMPVYEDLLEDWRLLPPELRVSYMPTGQENLANLWVHLLQLSLELEEILSTNYKPGGHLPQLSETNPLAGRVAMIRKSISHSVDHTDPNISLHVSHLRACCK